MLIFYSCVIGDNMNVNNIEQITYQTLLALITGNSIGSVGHISVLKDKEQIVSFFNLFRDEDETADEWKSVFESCLAYASIELVRLIKRGKLLSVIREALDMKYFSDVDMRESALDLISNCLTIQGYELSVANDAIIIRKKVFHDLKGINF